MDRFGPRRGQKSFLGLVEPDSPELLKDQSSTPLDCNAPSLLAPRSGTRSRGAKQCLLEGIEVGGDVAGLFGRYSLVWHAVAGDDGLGMLKPTNKIVRLVGENACDLRAL
jgi:hypothetical protein